MSNYRRNFVEGGSFFFTVNLADRRSGLLVDRIDLVRHAFRYTKSRHPFTINAIVVLPDHLHAIWTLPSGDADYATRWRLIKTVFSNAPKAAVSNVNVRSGSADIGSTRCETKKILGRHCDYIHYNPVKHGHVKSAADWLYSSFRRFVRRGLYSADWGGVIGLEETAFGERGDKR